MDTNKPFVSIEYLPVADNTVVTGDSSAVTQAGKLVALDDSGKINRYFVPYSLLSVTSVSVDDGDKLTGDIRLYGSGTISVTRSGNDIYVSPNFPIGVTGISVGDSLLTGTVALLAGSGLSITADPVSNAVLFRNTGVNSINGLKENINFVTANGISVTQTDASTLTFSLDKINWSQFDSSSSARASKVVVNEGIYFGDNEFASIYHFNNQTILRGASGVTFLDPVKVDSLVVSGGNGVFINQSRIQDISGTLHIAPSSGVVVFPSGSSIVNVQSIQGSLVTGDYLTLDPSSGLYTKTFSHTANLYPLSLLVTQVTTGSLSEIIESTRGYGANLINEFGYNVSYTRDSITVQAKFENPATESKLFKVRCMFASEEQVYDIPDPSSITSAPIQPSVHLLGVPSGGGFATDILLSTRPVDNATSYEWYRVSDDYTWTTATPFLSTSLDSTFKVSKPGSFLHRVRALNSTGSGEYSDFNITLRPLKPILVGPISNIQDMGVYFFKKGTISLVYQSGLIKIVDLLTNQEIQLETPLTYSPPASSLGDYPPVDNVSITLINLLPNTSYSLVARAYIDDAIYSDFSTPLDIYIPS